MLDLCARLAGGQTENVWEVRTRWASLGLHFQTQITFSLGNSCCNSTGLSKFGGLAEIHRYAYSKIV